MNANFPIALAAAVNCLEIIESNNANDNAAAASERAERCLREIMALVSPDSPEATYPPMTVEDVPARHMSPDQLRVAVAEKLGWKESVMKGCWRTPEQRQWNITHLGSEDGPWSHGTPVPNYSTDHTAAISLCDHLSKFGHVELSKSVDGWICTVDPDNSNGEGFIAETGDTLPIAICKALLATP